MSRMESSVDQFDSVRLLLTGLSGALSHVTLSTEAFKKTLSKEDTIAFKENCELHDPLVHDPTSSYGQAVIGSSSLHPLPWLSTDTKRVGGAMCHLQAMCNSAQSVSPRAVAAAQVSRLREEFGLVLKSAFEVEFMVFENNGNVPFHDCKTPLYGRADALRGQEEVFLRACQSLKAARLPLETFMTELDPGQFEITLKPEEGISSPDSVVLLKDGLRTCFKGSALTPSFMTSPTENGLDANGFHFNHSLWKEENITEEQDDKALNAFCDDSNPEFMSNITRHWLAGLVEHAPAMSLICSPTFNCERRLNGPVTPSVANWGIENRTAFLRVRNSGGNVYIENRLPASACNPYLVVAGVLAAGMDGLRRQLECPPQMDPGAGSLPKTLEGAVVCLENDTQFTQLLGPEVCRAFVKLERAQLDSRESRGLCDLEKQKEIYFSHI